MELNCSRCGILQIPLLFLRMCTCLARVVSNLIDHDMIEGDLQLQDSEKPESRKVKPSLNIIFVTL